MKCNSANYTSDSTQRYRDVQLLIDQEIDTRYYKNTVTIIVLQYIRNAYPVYK